MLQGRTYRAHAPAWERSKQICGRADEGPRTPAPAAPAPRSASAHGRWLSGRTDLTSIIKVSMLSKPKSKAGLLYKAQQSQSPKASRASKRGSTLLTLTALVSTSTMRMLMTLNLDDIG